MAPLELIIYVLFGMLFVAPAVAVVTYYFVLIVLRLGGAKAGCPESQEHVHRFAIVIPAHNEEEALSRTLQSCQQLAYQEGKYEVFVVADNCSDSTAEVARQYGVTCLQRNDPSRPGKGQALQWAFQQIISTPHDAIVVLDADCRIDSHALGVFDRCLTDGSRVLQANHVTSNCDDAAPSYVARVGQLLEYDFAYAPKSCLGLFVPLVGTGMVLHRDVLQEHPWNEGSVVEDVEYTLRLAEAGIAVRFVSNVAVRHDSEKRLDQLKVQRSRWAQGTLHLGRRKGLGLLASGIAKRRMLIADAGWTLLTMSRPLILLHAALTLGLAAWLAYALPGTTARVLCALAGVAVLGHVAYYSLGIATLGLNWRRVCLLLATPLVVVRLMTISLHSLFTVRDPQWERTPR